VNRTSRSARVLPGRKGEAAAPLARRRRSRTGKRRWLSPLLAGLGTAALAAGVWWMLTAPVFRVAVVETSRYRFTDRDTLDGHLRDWLARDMNIWTLDGESLCREIEALPWVRRARIGRRLPATLKLDIWEWRPLLLLPDGEGGGVRERALVQNGATLPLPAHLPPPDLPLLVDEAGASVRDADTAERLLGLLAAVGETGLETACEVDFILREPRGLVVVLAGNRGRLLVGREDFAVRLQRYLDVSDRVPSGAELDLRFERQVYIEESRRASRGDRSRSG